MITTERYYVEAFTVLNRSYSPVLLVKVHKPGNRLSGDASLSLGSCALYLNGVVATRAQLLEWLPTRKDPQVEVDRDSSLYGRVQEARFSD